jgi:hypothetical protein
VSLIRYGAKALFGGARRGSAPLAGLGALAVGFGWIRKRYRGDRELLYARTLRRGDSLRIRMLQGDDPVEGGEIEVSG